MNYRKSPCFDFFVAVLLFSCCIKCRWAAGRELAVRDLPLVSRILFSGSRAVAGCGLSDKALLSPRRELLCSFRNHGFMVQTSELFVVNLGSRIAQALALPLP